MAVLLACSIAMFSQEGPVHMTASKSPLMPVPASIQFQSGRLNIDSSFAIAVDGFKDARMERAVQRGLRRLADRTGFELATEPAKDAASATLVIRCKKAGQAVQSFDEDESYSLEINDRHAILSSNTVVGTLRGLETVLQLVTADRGGYYLPPVRIEDHPRFAWRGLMIDVSRHFEPVEVIRRNLDGMAAVKLNVFHWHLTDDQGFRVESKLYPRLQQMGSDGLFYTQDQVREVVEYARDRGIRVIPEFDMPGHVSSWLAGYPDLASAPGPYKIERLWGIFDPAMDPTREETYKFLDGFLGEMAKLFPDPYMHVGGDESNGKQWMANPKIRTFMEKNGIKDAPALQAYFNRRLVKILQKRGKIMIGWDEVFHPDLPKDVVVQSWRGEKSLAAGARLGYQGVLSAPYYLDFMKTAATFYHADPISAGSDLTAEQKSRILGGEACIWSEYITPEVIDSRVWPRLAAIAERFWSPQTVNDDADMYRRLATTSLRLEEFGLRHNNYADSLLRRLAGSADIAPLKTISRLTDPGSNPERASVQIMSQNTPLTRLADAFVPDPAGRWELTAMVDGLLSDSPRFRAHRENLANEFNQWLSVRPAMDVVVAQNPILRDAEPLVTDIADLGNAGLEALAYLSSGNSAPAAWKQQKLELLSRAAKPKAGSTLAIIEPMRKLIVAASGDHEAAPAKVSSR